ncbi:hypothetical protein BJF78_06615 [Pseudonocardia sp. CNS-139]|nr:hypothetical protein BJF78_06615 [Pseudonocardia sp. CNS-139]
MLPSRLFRVRSALLVAAVFALAGCAAPAAPASPGDPAPGTRTVTHERGEVEVPVVPDRVVALDEYAALNLLTAGIEPVAVFGGLSSEVGAEVLAARGIDVTPAPTMIVSPDLEAIAATRPDVVVLTSSGAALDRTYPELSRIAPTVVVPFEGPWRAPLELVGRAFDRDDSVGRTLAALDRRVADLAADPAEPVHSISVLGSFQNLLYSPAPPNPGSQVLAAAGFGRPQPELAAASGASASTVPVSPETLGGHDADVVVVLDGSIYDADAVAAVPTFGSLPAVRDGRTARANGEMWSGGTALATWWLLDDLATLAGGGTALGTPADAAARMAALEAAAR